MHARSATKRLVALTAAALACTQCRRAMAITEGFESFTGASFSTVDGYTDNGNSWSNFAGTASKANGVAANVVTGDSSAYSGLNYLRLVDGSTAASTTAAARDTLSSTISVADTTMTISFALRDDATLNQNQFVLYNTSTASAGAVLQAGIHSGGAFNYVSYAGATATNHSLSQTATAGHWYLFLISYSASSTSLAGTYSMQITDASAPDTPVYSATGLSGQSAFTSVANEVIGNIVVQTSDGGQGYADFDALSIAAPEPATLCLGVLGGSAFLLRRRRSLPVNSLCKPTAGSRLP